MKLIAKIFLFLSFFTNHIYASNIDNISYEIAYASQNIASDYLYLYNDSKNSIYKSRLKNSVDSLEDSFRALAKVANDRDTKDILDFLSYSKDQIKDTIEKDLSKERVSEILDYSGTILEGVESVMKSTKENLTSKSETKLNFLKLKKFYISYKLGFDKQNSKNELQKQVDILDENMQGNLSWNSYKRLLDLDGAFFPNMIQVLTKDLEDR